MLVECLTSAYACFKNVQRVLRGCLKFFRGVLRCFKNAPTVLQVFVFHIQLFLYFYVEDFHVGPRQCLLQRFWQCW